MIGIMEKILGLWDANSFFPLLMWGVLVSQMVTYLIYDLRKEFFKRVQARFR